MAQLMVQSLLSRVAILQGLPQFFGGPYVLHQFGGWKLRNSLSGRTEGSEPSAAEHPDVGRKFEALPQSVQQFIGWMSMWQLLMFSSLTKQQLTDLRASGAPEAVLDEGLRAIVNERHHIAWMAARDSFVLLGQGSVRVHPSHKAHAQLSPEEIAADNAQVTAYGSILATMEDSDFEALLALCSE